MRKEEDFFHNAKLSLLCLLVSHIQCHSKVKKKQVGSTSENICNLIFETPRYLTSSSQNH